MRKFLLGILVALAVVAAPIHVGAQDYYPAAIGDFDGTNDWLTRGAGLTGAADVKVGTFSFWARFTDLATARNVFQNNTGRIRFSLSSTGILTLNGYSYGGVSKLVVRSSNNQDDGQYHHHLVSFNLATTTVRWYVDDVDDATITTSEDSTLDYTDADWGLAAAVNGNLKTTGAFSEFYMALEYLDLSVEANRRKFISSTGHPVDLGPSCSTPTGTASIICMRTQFNNAGLNDGTGGDFVINGAPTYTQGPVPIPLTTWRPGTKRGRGGRGGRSTIQQELR